MQVMSIALPITEIRIHSLAIPMRQKFSHATAERATANPIIVAIELADHSIGYGETHPRPYVTGESHKSVLATIRNFFTPRLLEMRPANFGEAIEAIADLPLTDDNDKVITAARAAVELALLDAYAKAFDRSFDHIAGWLGQSFFGSPGSQETARFGGVISSMDASRIPRSIRKMRLGRLTSFKLKVGDEGDDERLHTTIRSLGRGLTNGKLTLRLDANAAWSLEQAAARLQKWEDLPIVCVEQPLSKSDVVNWAILSQNTSLPLMADESLVTPRDAEELILHRAASWFNIRISKNGGLIPAMRLAMIAHRDSVDCQLGCMVGETSILSAAARWFLQMVPNIRFTEGNFGRFLLRDDVTNESLRFGCAGRWKPLFGPGLGISVNEDKLHQLSDQPPVKIHL